MKRIRIHLYHKLPTPYNDLLFKAFHADERIDLQVHHLWRGLSSRPWTVALGKGYPNRYLDVRLLGIDWPLLRTAVGDRGSFFLIGDWAHASSIAALVARVLLRAPVSIWADTPQEQLPRPWYKRVPRRAFLHWLLPRMDVIFATGKPGMRAIQEMGTPPERIVNLPYFVDLQLPLEMAEDRAFCAQAQAYRARAGCGRDATVFLVAGQLTYKKGHEIALEAFAEARRRSDAPMGMLIAGEGPRRPQLETLVERLGLREQVAFLGWVDPAAMYAAYSACDVFVHSARWDPYPLVILESMSWGKAVIGSDVCGSVEDRIVHAVNGFSFPSEDVTSLAEIMQEVATDPDLRKRIGRAARATAEQWPVSFGVETIIRTAREVLARHGGAREP